MYCNHLYIRIPASSKAQLLTQIQGGREGERVSQYWVRSGRSRLNVRENAAYRDKQKAVVELR